MISFTKKINLMMVMICCLPQFIQASSDLFDQDDRTNVIRCVIDIENKKMELKKLWRDFFYTQQIMTGHTCIQGHTIPTYTYVTTKKVDTTDENVAQYERAKVELDLFIEDAIENIKLMVSNGADLSVQDEFGKTVIDYCSVEKVYNVLRELGAPFSLTAWMHFHYLKTMAIGIIGAPIIIVGGMALVKYVVDCYE